MMMGLVSAAEAGGRGGAVPGAGHGERRGAARLSTGGHLDIHCRVDILHLHVSNISIRLQVVSSILSDLDTDIHRSRVPTCQQRPQP